MAGSLQHAGETTRLVLVEAAKDRVDAFGTLGLRNDLVRYMAP